VNSIGAFCWGYDGSGELGDSDGTGGGMSQSLPKQVPGVASPTMIAAGARHACAAAASGAKCWGCGGSGQLGGGATPDFSGPVAVTGAGPMWMPSRLAAGGDHTCAVDTAGRLRCWGSNSNGEIGDGTFQERATPAVINALGTTTVDVTLAEA
jgi:alpha-tubulin suppressor-like RCC1 family protein